MAAFRSLDQRMRRDVRQLHDYLWEPNWKGDETELRDKLARDARELDAYLRAGGKLRKSAEALTKAWGRGPEGESLFELLEHTYDLTAATEHVKKGDYMGAGELVAQAVGSMSIGICANAGCFEFVEEWEGGKTDFETYTSKIADVLQGKGIERAGDFKRMMLAAYNFGKAWDPKAPKAERALAARAAIANAAWCAVAVVSIRTAIGAPPKFPSDDYAWVISRIASRL